MVKEILSCMELVSTMVYKFHSDFFFTINEFSYKIMRQIIYSVQRKDNSKIEIMLLYFYNRLQEQHFLSSALL